MTYKSASWWREAPDANPKAAKVFLRGAQRFQDAVYWQQERLILDLVALSLANPRRSATIASIESRRLVIVTLATRSRGMEIAFSTKSLRDTCESEEMSRQKFGPEVAERLKRRLADLRAASSIKDIVLGNVREVPRTRGPAMCVDLFNGYRLVIRANHIQNPTLATGKVDWSAVSRIKITRIERPND